MSYQFILSTNVVRSLQVIERVRESVRLTPLPSVVIKKLRKDANIRATHHSTLIEGNRMTLLETEQIIQQGILFPGRERDVGEVNRYYQALQQIEKWADNKIIITESRIQKIHAALYSGKSSKPTPYRDGQNVIRGEDGSIVYMPPESQDVPMMMSELINWIQQSQSQIPIPVVAGVAHYQFETIHPFYDGNGRTGRLLTTWILYQSGYDLEKFYSLEEFYTEDLAAYYNSLITHPHHNYYFGKNQADITSWLEYFLNGMAVIFEQVAKEITMQSTENTLSDKDLHLWRKLDPRARRVIGLFSNDQHIKSSNVAALLGLSVRQARDLLANWVTEGWLEIADPSKKGRKYKLSNKYQRIISKIKTG